MLAGRRAPGRSDEHGVLSTEEHIQLGLELNDLHVAHERLQRELDARSAAASRTAAEVQTLERRLAQLSAELHEERLARRQADARADAAQRDLAHAHATDRAAADAEARAREAIEVRDAALDRLLDAEGEVEALRERVRKQSEDAAIELSLQLEAAASRERDGRAAAERAERDTRRAASLEEELERARAECARAREEADNLLENARALEAELERAHARADATHAALVSAGGAQLLAREELHSLRPDRVRLEAALAELSRTVDERDALRAEVQQARAREARASGRAAGAAVPPPTPPPPREGGAAATTGAHVPAGAASAARAHQPPSPGRGAGGGPGGAGACCGDGDGAGAARRAEASAFEAGREARPLPGRPLPPSPLRAQCDALRAEVARLAAERDEARAEAEAAARALRLAEAELVQRRALARVGGSEPGVEPALNLRPRRLRPHTSPTKPSEPAPAVGTEGVPVPRGLSGMLAGARAGAARDGSAGEGTAHGGRPWRWRFDLEDSRAQRGADVAPPPPAAPQAGSCVARPLGGGSAPAPRPWCDAAAAATAAAAAPRSPSPASPLASRSPSLSPSRRSDGYRAAVELFAARTEPGSRGAAANLPRLSPPRRRATDGGATPSSTSPGERTHAERARRAQRSHSSSDNEDESERDGAVVW